MNINLQGRKALVTAATQGIGRAIALGLAEAGADVMIHGGSRADLAAATVAELENRGVRAASVLQDMSAPDAVTRVAAATLEAIGEPDILVPGVAIQERCPWPEISRELFDRHLTTNLRSTFELIQRFLPGMTARGWGRILVIGSVQEVMPHPDMLPYAAAKAALTSMVRNLARQVAARGVTINNLAPGVILTERNTAALDNDAYRQKVLDRIPAGHFGEPHDCTGAALLLCSDAGRYITGQRLLVDGGMSLK